MADFEVKCTCGNIGCHQEIHIRKGYVSTLVDEGYNLRQVRWNELYINTYGLSKNDRYGEVMLERSDALRLAWWLIRNFWRR